MMPSCKQVARLLGSGELDRASFAIRLAGRLHLWMCRHCARFASQLRLLGSAARRAHELSEREGDSLEERITRNLLRRP
jgi:hypothetical protein